MVARALLWMQSHSCTTLATSAASRRLPILCARLTYSQHPRLKPFKTADEKLAIVLSVFKGEATQVESAAPIRR
jgi:hypothetical protein